MKQLILSVFFLTTTLSTYALDCAAPPYSANAQLKKYCLELQESVNASIQSTHDRFAKDYSQYKMVVDAEIKQEEAAVPEPAVQPHHPQSQGQPSSPVPTTQPAPAQAYTPPTAGPAQPTTPPPAPSSKPRRYY